MSVARRAANRRTGADHVMTEKQREFVQAYNGNASEAAQAVSVSTASAREWAKQAWFKEALRAREAAFQAEQARKGLSTLGEQVIASTAEVQAFWTKTMLDEEETAANRLRASELIAKANGVFIEKREIKSENKTTVQVDERDVGERIALLRGFASEN